jgi:ribosomal protein L40E
MVKKTVGYVQLEWTCPNCGAKNPGPQKTCTGCGGPQPQDVQFEQAAQEQLITDKEQIKQAKAGPDVHCTYCGARNPAGAAICSQCGADLAEGTARASGQVVGAHRDKPAPQVPCPSCGSPNPANALQCSQCGASMAQPKPPPPRPAAAPQKGGCGPVVYIAGAAVILLAIVLGIFLTRTSDIVGSVENVSWTRTVAVMELGPVTREDWRDEVPSEGAILSCTEKVHHTQSESAPNSREVCGTPYTVDKGSGYGEVIQDCEYEVYADWCKYEIDEWRKVDEINVSGSDLNAYWPAVQLAAQQREGDRDEVYEVVFEGDGETYSYETRDPAEFARFQVGSRWLLKVNQLNAVVSVEPYR